jgi:hypothetical protein
MECRGLRNVMPGLVVLVTRNENLLGLIMSIVDAGMSIGVIPVLLEEGWMIYLP